MLDLDLRTERLLSDVAVFVSNRNVQGDDGHFLGTSVMLVIAVAAVILSVFFLSYPFVGGVLTGVYVVGGLGLAFGLVVLGVSLWLLYNKFAERLEFLKQCTLQLTSLMDSSQAEEVFPIVPEAEGLKKNTLIRLICPYVENMKDKNGALHPFSKVRQFCRMATVLTGVIAMTFGVIVFTILSPYLGTTVMISLGVGSILSGIVFFSFGVSSERTQMVNCRLYAFSLLSSIQKLKAAQQRQVFRAANEGLKKENTRLIQLLKTARKQFSKSQEQTRVFEKTQEEEDVSAIRKQEGVTWGSLVSGAFGSVGSWITASTTGVDDRSEPHGQPIYRSLQGQLSLLSHRLGCIEESIAATHDMIKNQNRDVSPGRFQEAGSPILSDEEYQSCGENDS